jgi:flavin-dependent dehydrogenase
MVASRAYFEGVHDISDVWQLRFDGIPLPGYGWIFPTGNGAANIGAGYFARNRKSSATNAFDQFTRTPALRELLLNAKQISPIKGFPLRADFTTSPTFSNRVLLVGEAAGLVNPLTGEGIDYALESGRIAAKHIARVFERDDFSRASIQQYDDELRLHFQSLFEFCMFVRDRLCDKAWLLNFLVRTANKREDLRTRLARVVLGSEAVTGKLTFGRAMKTLLRKV